jgi:hypothetical protein
MKLFKHEDYDSNTFQNDIALFKLSYPATLNDFVQVACLPILKNDKYPNFNQEHWLVGWTDFVIDLEPNQYILRRSPMNVFDSQLNPFCYNIRDQSNKICAGLDINIISICNFDAGKNL